MNEAEKKIYQDVEDNHAHVVEMRRHLHKHPELSTKEFETQKYIEHELEQLGLSYVETATTGVITDIKGNLPGDKVIVLRADIDALPVQEEHQCAYTSTIDGVMHACGHDAHTASLLGAIKILNDNKDLFGGTVRCIFQPGEEIGYGARVIIEEGHLKGVDRTFGIHLGSNIPVGDVVIMEGANNASVDWFKISIHGKSAHVSTPEQGVDAAYIVSLLVTSIQSLITRKTNPMENILVGIGKIEAGTAYNVVAQEAYFEGTIRALSSTLRAQMKQDIETLCTNICNTYGATVDFEWKDFTSVLVNDPQSTKEAQRVAKSIFGPEHVIEKRQPALGGDDMAEFINVVPGVYAYVGSANADIAETTVAHHNSHFDIDERSLLNEVLLYSCYAIAYLKGIEL